MKKTILSFFSITIGLFLCIFYMGELVHKESIGFLNNSDANTVTTKLISYEKQFLTAKMVSEVEFSVEQSDPILLQISSDIKHYPHKAVINNRIKVISEPLAQQVSEYFAGQAWLTSQEEISWFGSLTGQLVLAKGSYQENQEQIQSLAATLNYEIDLNSKAGQFSINWGGLNANTNRGDMSIEGFSATADFQSINKITEYEYRTKINKLVIKNSDNLSTLENLQLNGSSHIGSKQDTVNTSNEWRLASYQVGNDAKQVFTDNHIKLDIKGLYSPAFEILSSASEDQLKVEQALTDLVAFGAQLNLLTLSSQTPWGKIQGNLEVDLHKGTPFLQIMNHPFMILDYISGDANLSLPAALLSEPVLAEPLQMGLMSGLLKREEQVLTFQTELKQGELTVNGQVIPL